MRATIVIPTYNEGDRLERVVRAVLCQKTPFPFEVLVIDANSTDGSTDKLPKASVRRLTIPHDTFNHGQTRNIGASMARGRQVLFLVADAVPIGSHWLRTLSETLDHYPDAVAGYARQRAWPNADPALKRRLEVWTPPGKMPVVKELAKPSEYWSLSPAERIRLAAFDNVCSIVERDYLMKHPFPNLPFGEDIAWGQVTLLDGRGLLYIPAAEVYHSHHRNALQHVIRARAEHLLLKKTFGLRAVPHLPALLGGAVGLVLQNVRSKTGTFGFERQGAELVGQYLAGRTP